ncbi:MAG: bifunctional demethylmenaquinone methyltransferase/2-methoxy-6-polyprenyl-1,4-benzoquinol methylase UbiE [Microcoleaceae cyanobacterium]
MSQVQAIFDRIAPIYDQMNDWLSFGLHRVWKQMAVDWSCPIPEGRALDLCCGSGDLALRLAQKVGPRGQVWGVDFSSAQLATARQRELNATLPAADITWIESDVLNLPLADNSFDCATMGYGLRNVGNIPQCLRELYRVLRPGASAAILDMHRPPNHQLIAFQQWYLKTIVVPIAERQGMKSEYDYIQPSLDQFPTGPEQIALAQQIGFHPTTHYLLAGGMMGVLVLTKPSTLTPHG